MKKTNTLWTVVFFLVIQTLQAQSNLRRIAYLIGNSHYEDSTILYNPANDARDLGRNLKELGFEVHSFENVKRATFQDILRGFGQTLSKDPEHTVGLFFYAGHGMQIDGRNFLLPTDAIDLADLEDAEEFCITLDSILATVYYAQNKMNIIVLDACRTNPFLFSPSYPSQRDSIIKVGLAAVEAPVGTLVAFSTSPNSVALDGDGLNGLYTQELIKAIHIPDLTIEQVFKKVRTQVKEISDGEQIPWENSSLESEFYFKRNPQVTAKGVFLTSANENLPLPERYARDMCGCMTGLVTLAEKIDKMPKQQSAEVMRRLEEEKAMAIEQSTRCINTATKDYLPQVTPDIDKQTMLTLEKICPTVHRFINAKN
ncbi:MAG: caspase family protein [Saprospiraceae bacterium]|nr:caspase family protein [Saprospiraceae bacterium]